MGKFIVVITGLFISFTAYAVEDRPFRDRHYNNDRSYLSDGGNVEIDRRGGRIYLYDVATGEELSNFKEKAIPSLMEVLETIMENKAKTERNRRSAPQNRILE